MNEPSDLARPANRTPGSVLAAAREAAGLTQTDVAGQMRISLRQLVAIEADRYEELPGPVFVRGFIKNYARLLNLDPAPLLQSLESALSADMPLREQHYEGAMPDSRSGRARLWLAIFLVLLAGVLGAAAYEYWRNRAAVESTVPAVGGAPKKSTASAPTTIVPSTTSEPVPLAPERVGEAATAPEKGALSGEATSGRGAADPAQPTPGTLRLHIQFVGESWFEVRDKSGKVLFSGTGSAGTEQNIDVAPPLELVIGNASGVRITYNRQPVDVTARASRNIARFTLE